MNGPCRPRGDDLVRRLREWRRTGADVVAVQRRNLDQMYLSQCCKELNLTGLPDQVIHLLEP